MEQKDESISSACSCPPTTTMSRAGIEPISPVDHTQVIDFTKRQKRQNRYCSRIEVHGGCTGYEFLSSRWAL
jgi:hypothetical protein